jgi:hypothetical protein
MLSNKFIVASPVCDFEWEVEYNPKDDLYEWTVLSGSGLEDIIGQTILTYNTQKMEELIVGGYLIKEYIELPDYFEFEAPSGKYYMRKESDGVYQCGSDWDTLVCTYTQENTMTGVEFVKKNFKNGVWKMLPTKHEEKPVANGVDAEGKPFHFTEDMLEIFQRVVTKNGKEYIVAPNVQTYDSAIGSIVAARNDNWVQLSYLHGDCQYGDYSVVEVWGLPEYNNDLLNPSVKGKLIWKYVEPKKYDLPAKFYFKHIGYDTAYTATLNGDKYVVTWNKSGITESHSYLRSDVEEDVENGIWIIQQNPFKDRLDQLGSHIKSLQAEYDKLKVEAEKV